MNNNTALKYSGTGMSATGFVLLLGYGSVVFLLWSPAWCLKCLSEQLQQLYYVFIDPYNEKMLGIKKLTENTR